MVAVVLGLAWAVGLAFVVVVFSVAVVLGSVVAVVMQGLASAVVVLVLAFEFALFQQVLFAL